MRSFFLVFIFLLFSLEKANASDSLLINKLIQKIYQQQVQSDSYFPKGLFPAQREYHFNKGNLKKDDNSFFTGLIVFTLRQLRPYLDNSGQQICDSITSNARPAFKYFQNRKGKHTYNFWPTNPVKFFPNSGVLSLFKSKALPDDADCSVIVLMALQDLSPFSSEVHDYFQEFVNQPEHPIKSTYSYFKNLPAYSTWLGHKIPVDFDVCVLSNILYFVHKNHLSYTKADSASLHFISQSVEKRLYMTDPVYLSSYYNKTSVILYHLARLMSIEQIPELERFRKQLIDDTKYCLEVANSSMEKVILASALIKWNQEPPLLDLDYLRDDSITRQNFSFFVANLASTLPNPINRIISRSKIGKFDYYCPAYNDVLLLEYLVLRNKGRNF